MVDVAAFEGWADLSAKDAVLVSFCFRFEPWMKIEVCLFGSRDADIARKQAVHGSRQIIHRDRIVNGECGHLRQRVNAGVGAPGASHWHWLAFDSRDHFLQSALDGGEAGLYLPAVIIGTVVGKLDLNSPHGQAAIRA